MHISNPIEVVEIEIERMDVPQITKERLPQSTIKRALVSGLLYGFQGVGQIIHNLASKTFSHEVLLQRDVVQESEGLFEVQKISYEVKDLADKRLGFIFVKYYIISRLISSENILDFPLETLLLLSKAVDIIDAKTDGNLSHLITEFLVNKEIEKLIKSAEIISELIPFKSLENREKYFVNMLHSIWDENLFNIRGCRLPSYILCFLIQKQIGKLGLDNLCHIEVHNVYVGGQLLMLHPEIRIVWNDGKGFRVNFIYDNPPKDKSRVSVKSLDVKVTFDNRLLSTNILYSIFIHDYETFHLLTKKPIDREKARLLDEKFKRLVELYKIDLHDHQKLLLNFFNQIF